MKNNVGKILGSIFAIVIIGAFVFCSVWTVRNWNTVYHSLDGSSVYNYNDIKRAEEEAYAKGAKNETEYKKTISDLRDQLTNAQIKYNNDTEKLQLKNEDLQSIIDSYKDVFNDIKDYIETPEKAVVIYESEDALYDIQTVNKGSTGFTPRLENPTKTGYHFVGWSLNGTDIVDTSNLTVNDNITLSAVFEINIYSVKFVADENVIYETTMTHGSIISNEQINAINTSEAMQNYLATLSYESNNYEINWISGQAKQGTDGEYYPLLTDNFIVIEDLIFNFQLTENLGDIGDIPDKPIDITKYY